MEFPGGEGFPALVYDGISGGGGEASNVIINYRRTDDEFGPSVVNLTLYTRESWDAFLAQSFGGNWWDGECVQQRELDLGDRTATLITGRAPQFVAGQPCSQPYKYAAHVFIGDTVVDMDAPGASGPGGSFDSPYNSDDGMEFLMRSLYARAESP
jgi:hypothetical protein